MVGVGKWLSHRVVAPICVGSNPTIHPISLGYRQAVRQRILIPSCAGSNPATLANLILCPAKYRDKIWRHSQVVRHWSAKPLFPGSNLGVASIKKLVKIFLRVFYYPFFITHFQVTIGCLPYLPARKIS